MLVSPRQCTLLVIVLSFIGSAQPFVLDPATLGNTLDGIARDGLGVQDMQAYLDSLDVDVVTINSTTINELKTKLSEKFQVRVQAAWRLKTAVELSYFLSAPKHNPECCSVDSGSLTYDTRFRQQVRTTQFCVRKASGATNPTQLTNEVLKAMEDNMKESPYLKWQYFGSVEGLTTIYPMQSQAECGSYDNRARPWYVDAAAPKPKNVVLVVDSSGSMAEKHTANGKTWLQMAIDAAKAVLDTLNPRDKVGVVSLATDANTPGSNDTTWCYANTLAEANSVNINNMKIFLDGMRSAGFTMYIPALTKAFALLLNSKPESPDDCDQVIIFLTDAKPTELKESVMRTIVESNKLLDNRVVILAYGIGAEDFSFLGDMVRQSGYNQTWDPAAGQVTPGIWKQITDIGRLREEMVTYYNFFFSANDPSTAEPRIAVPYHDAWGLGLITTVTLPCYHGNTFVGVVGIDITMGDLLADVSYFGAEQESYAFVIDGSGRGLVHPLLPMPSNADQDYASLEIRTLEPDAPNSIFDSMQSGESGEERLLTRRFLPRAGSKAGVRVRTVNTTYYWQKVDGTNFSVCLVLVKGDSSVSLKPLSPIEDFKFIYHRLDLLKPELPCTQFQRYAVKSSSVVKFSADVFTDPYQYIGLSETSTHVMQYFMYMLDRSNTVENPGFRAGIKDDVLASYRAESIWLKSESLNDYVVWRYIGSGSGVFRLFPGVILAKNYDPTKRTWYQGAIDNPGNNTLSTPYIDAFGAGLVITLSHTVTKGQGEVFGVMGADFTLRFFHRMLGDTYIKCKDPSFKCFIMDSSGFLAFHEDFLSPDITAATVEDVHITEKLKSVAQDMIDKGILVQNHCRDLIKIGKQMFYEVHLNESVTNVIGTSTCKMYEIHPIANSNLYLVGTVPMSEDTQGLEKCFDTLCTKKVLFEECYGVVGCSWCVMDENNKAFDEPFCTEQNLCYGGRYGMIYTESMLWCKIRYDLESMLRCKVRMLGDTYIKCKDPSFKCFIMDSSGFLAFHEDFLSPDITAATVEDVHITEKLKSVAQDMIDKGILVQNHCRDLIKIGKQMFYEVHLNESVTNVIGTSTCKMYEIHPIANSNLYLGNPVPGAPTQSPTAAEAASSLPLMKIITITGYSVGGAVLVTIAVFVMWKCLKKPKPVPEEQYAYGITAALPFPQGVQIEDIYQTIGEIYGGLPQGSVSSFESDSFLRDECHSSYTHLSVVFISHVYDAEVAVEKPPPNDDATCDLKQEWKQKLLEKHNGLRSQLSPGASDLDYLHGNLSEPKFDFRNCWGSLWAQMWANKCWYAVHGFVKFGDWDSERGSAYGGKTLGQNIKLEYGDYYQKNPTDGVQDWFDERQHYTYGKHSPRNCRRPSCGHYTAMVGNVVKTVGCAIKCPLKCQNGGKLDGETCTCTCKDGYKGADCADKLCSPGKYGWNCESLTEYTEPYDPDPSVPRPN
ncbi:predicted protein [Nematostella vectensis]|uniref:VWFA domain-containing protein n=1 Tax=Nematostella vectensis TaxID=45351 RepID=A7RNR9_NEMVE|nr:predicted protein [Nematostella vectensis]|eukprot:XP_001639042.1 predicted protein [Nematostella vectensis]